MKWTAWVLAVSFALLCRGTAIGAEPAAESEAETEAETEKPSALEFEFFPYLWLPGNFGSVDVEGNTATVDVSVRDVLDIATSGNAFTGTGYFGIRYDRWSAFVDAFGGYLRASVAEKIPTQFCCVTVGAKAEIRPVIVDFAVGYRLGQWAMPGRQRPTTLGVYAGMRYMHYGAKLDANLGVVGGLQKAGRVSDTFNWADPMIGVRWEVPLFDQLTLDFRGDIGGFGVSSDLIWGLVADVRYWLSWKPMAVQPWLGAGYRDVAFDRGSSSDNIELQFRGPLAGMGFVF